MPHRWRGRGEGAGPLGRRRWYRNALLFCLAGLCASGLSLAIPQTAAGEGATSAAESTRLFLEGAQAYEEGDFDRAVEAFLDLAEGGIRNPTLYYNLGNAYLKAGRLGPAILWYERASLLTPGDPDLRYNLEYARGLTRDEGTAPGADLSRVLFFWRHQLGRRAVRWTALGLNAVFWGLLIARQFVRRRALRQAAMVTGGLALVFALTAVFDYVQDFRSAEAIILPEEVIVRSGLTEDSTELFRLHAGARVRIDRSQRDNFRIAFGKDRIGWVPAGAVGRIR